MSKILQTKQDFIAFFEAIPDERWITGSVGCPEDPFAPCCAGGHCLRNDGMRTWDKDNGSLGNLHALVLGHYHLYPQWINDGSTLGGANSLFPQKTPKERILAALRDLPDSN